MDKEVDLIDSEADRSPPPLARSAPSSLNGNKSREPVCIVGVGASAGGLEALERLFAGMPTDTGMAFVVVQHLSPDFKSLTDELLARRTPIPICQVEDGMQVEPNAIYLLPPRKEMILSNGRLLLTDKDPTQFIALPIDGFFRSLAQDCGSRAIGIVLSGTGSDGSRGIKAICEAGGFVIAQDPETARFDGMPKSAIAAGVQKVVAPEAMPAILLSYASSGRDATALASEGTPPSTGLETIFRLLRNAWGIDFSAYKSDTVTRRLDRRVALHRCGTLEEYADYLTNDPAEVNQLYKDLLIGVTRFFRDREAFALLAEALPPLLNRIDKDEEFRAWVAGCATGEEAYSLAILLQECVEKLQRPIPIKIFATDAHRASLEQAGTGIFGAASLAGLEPARLERFFVPRGDGYQVRPELRKLIVFAQHNVLKDAPFTKLDLVTCRNLLIYFQPPAQRKVLSLFHFGLKPRGVLFLGPSEGPGELADEFEMLDVRWKLYLKRRDVRLPPDVRMPATGLDRPRVLPASRVGSVLSHDPHFLSVLDALLDGSMKTSLLVNQAREVVRTFGGADRFLTLKGGWISTDVVDLVDPELRTALTGALPRVFRDTAPVVYKGLRVELEEGPRIIDVTVEPIRVQRAGPSFALIRLEEVGAAAVLPASPREIDSAQASKEEVQSLETELRSTKENLQAMIEELETSNEELQATNEELVASNEELQSTNEELHSVNEELYTVNAEYQNKIAELTELTTDMENLLASTEVHTVFLDRDLRIRKFTPKIAEAFNLLPQDIGRRIDNFTYTIEYPGLLGDLESVLASAESIERQVRDRRGNWFLLRVLPYRTGTVVGGVVLTLIDLTRVKEAEALAQEKERQLSGILRNSPNWVFIKDLEGRYLLVDDAFERLAGCDPTGKTAFELFSREIAELLTKQDIEVLREEREVQAEVVVPHLDGPHTYLSVMFPIRDEAGRLSALGGIRTDVTQLKRAEERAREAVEQRDRFLAMLSHELRNPLAAIVNASSLAVRQGSNPADVSTCFAIIQRRSQHMTRLLDDLLDVARITQGKLEICKQVFDLDSIVQDVLEEVRPRCDERNLSLSIQRCPHPLMVEGDPARLQQAQVNLLTNAVKYTAAGGRISYQLSAEEKDTATIRVRDEGMGMTPEILEKAFDLFVQGDHSLDRSAGGIGVGLTLVRSIVELHGGTVEAKSDGPGCGSEFVLRLPLTDRSPTKRAASPADPAVRPRNVEAEPGVRDLLLVEDDEDIRSTMTWLLRLEGFSVRAVSNGHEALAAIEDRRPDVALIDIGLPNMTGHELARKIRRKHPAGGPLRLVAVTGYGRPPDRQEAFQAGFDDHITKPIDPHQLARLLRSDGREGKL